MLEKAAVGLRMLVGVDKTGLRRGGSVALPTMSRLAKSVPTVCGVLFRSGGGIWIVASGAKLVATPLIIGNPAGSSEGAEASRAVELVEEELGDGVS